MRCQFCHNPDTWDTHAPVQYEWTPEQLMEEVMRYKRFIRTGGVTMTGGEPLMQSPFVSRFFDLCHAQGIHTCLDTSGAIWSEAAQAVADASDLVMLDIKTLDDSLHPAYTGLTRTNNQLWLDYLEQHHRPVWIRHVVVPGLTDSDDSIRRLADYLTPYTCVERIELLPYHAMGRQKYQLLGIPYPLEGVPEMTQTGIDHARALLRSLLPDIKIQ